MQLGDLTIICINLCNLGWHGILEEINLRQSMHEVIFLFFWEWCFSVAAPALWNNIASNVCLNLIMLFSWKDGTN